MDWSSVTALLAERSSKPVILLDRSGKVVLCNGALEQAVGWRRFEVEGKGFVEVFSAEERVAENRRSLGQALRGALRTYEFEARTRDGRRLALLLEIALVGRGRDTGVLLTVQQVTPVRAPGAAPGQDLDYEVDSTSAAFGRLTELSGIGSTVYADPTQTCHEALHKRNTPCEDCPIQRMPDQPWPRLAVRRIGGSSFELLTARQVRVGSVRISVRQVDDAALAAVHEAKVLALADQARLTIREREVLTYLLLGRSTEDIGALLDMKPRTVKFHQGNILQKLGADSRADLVRLVGW